jgi:Mor family transcriptional regulator
MEMSDSAVIPAETGKDKTSVPEFIFELIVEVARHVKSQGLSDLAAIDIARDTVVTLEKSRRGTLLYFSCGENSPDKDLLCTILVDRLAYKGIMRSKAEQIAKSIVGKVLFTYRGMKVYLPISDGEKKDREVRNAEIVAEYEEAPGFATIKKIVSKHNLSQTQVYAVIRKAGAKKNRRR